MAAFPFLHLPLELRREVYSSIAEDAPYTTAIHEYIGLVLSCRQIKKEFLEEYMKIDAKALATLVASLSQDTVRIPEVPSTFTEARYLIIQLPTTFQDDYSPYSIHIAEELPTSAKQMKRLALASLAIYLAKGADLVRWIRRIMYHAMLKPSDVCCLRLTLVMESSVQDELDVPAFLRLKAWGIYNWTYDGCINAGPVTTLLWKRVEER